MRCTPSSIEETPEQPLRTIAEVAKWLGVSDDEVRRMMKRRTKTGPLMTIPQVAAELGVHRSTVYKLMERGLLDYRLVGSDRRVRRQDVDLYIEGPS